MCSVFADCTTHFEKQTFYSLLMLWNLEFETFSKYRAPRPSPVKEVCCGGAVYADKKAGRGWFPSKHCRCGSCRQIVDLGSSHSVGCRFRRKNPASEKNFHPTSRRNISYDIGKLKILRQRLVANVTTSATLQTVQLRADVNSEERIHRRQKKFTRNRDNAHILRY